MAPKWISRFVLLAFLVAALAALAVLGWSLAHQRGSEALRSQPVVSRFAVHVTDATLQQEVIESNLPVIVVFHAPWCQPCHEMMPTLDIVAESFEGKIKLVLINGDEQEFCLQKYSIDRYPTMMMIQNGEERNRRVGWVNRNDLADWIRSVSFSSVP